MNDAPGIAPNPIASTRMLLGEGREEEIFLEALLAHLSITGVQIERYDGKSNLAPFLKALKNRSGFAQVIKLSILRDGDDDPVGAESSVNNAIAQAAFLGGLDRQDTDTPRRDAGRRARKPVPAKYRGPAHRILRRGVYELCGSRHYAFNSPS